MQQQHHKLFFKMANSFLNGEEMAGRETSKGLQTISKIEALGEEVLADKYQLVVLGKKRNGNREAINALRKMDEHSKKSWLCIGNTFFKFENDIIKKTLKDDQEELDKEIEEVRNGLTSKVSDLHKMEGQKDVNGFLLSSLSSDDMAFIKGDG